MPDLEALPGLDDLRRQAEAVLFSLGAPIERRKLADTLEVDLRTLISVLDALDVSLEGRGLMLQRHDDLVQLVTRPEASAAVRRLLNPEVPGPAVACGLRDPGDHRLPTAAHQGRHRGGARG